MHGNVKARSEERPRQVHARGASANPTRRRHLAAQPFFDLFFAEKEACRATPTPQQSGLARQARPVFRGASRSGRALLCTASAGAGQKSQHRRPTQQNKNKLLISKDLKESHFFRQGKKKPYRQGI
ncbi:MAG: hypothetical protein N3C59_07975 [Azovibrio sp.]|nr:hypothetical protein [Azovibrio sp.]